MNLLFLLFALSTLLLNVRGDDDPLPECDSRKSTVDILFLLDSSADLGPFAFKAQVAALIGFLHELAIGQEETNTRVGFINMGATANAIGTLTSYRKQPSAINDLTKNMNYTGSIGHDILGALRLANRIFTTEDRGKYVPKIVVLFSRNQFKCSTNEDMQICEEGMRLRSNGVILSTVHLVLQDDISIKKDKRTFDSGASLADIRYQFTNDKMLTQNLKQLVCTAGAHVHECDCQVGNLWLDMVFALDSSNGVGEQEFTSQKQMVASFINAIKISQSAGMYSRVAFVNAAKTADQVGNLLSYNSSEEAILALNSMQFQGGDLNQGASLNAAGKIATSHANRQNAKKVIVMFVGENIDCNAPTVGTPADFCRFSQVLINEGITIISIQMDLLKDPMHTGDKDDDKWQEGEIHHLRNSETLIEELIQLLCKANCFCPHRMTQVRYGGKRYGECLYLEEIPTGYESAKISCNKLLNMRMAQIQNSEKEDVLRDMAVAYNYDSYFVGLEKFNEDFYWIASAKLSKYMNFDVSQPTTSEKCTMVKITEEGSRWYVVPCSFTKPAAHYFCERDACDTANYCEHP